MQTGVNKRYSSKCRKRSMDNNIMNRLNFMNIYSHSRNNSKQSVDSVKISFNSPIALKQGNKLIISPENLK